MTIDRKKLDDLYNNKYFRINKILQEQTGLWPYSSKIPQFIRRLIVIFVLTAVLVPHLNGVRIWCGKSLGLCCENMSGIIYAFGVLSKYIVTITSEREISQVYELVAEIWYKITDPDEKTIMERYAQIGKYKSIGYVVYLTMAGISFSQLGMLPVVLDFILPLNQSRDKLLVVRGEFFVDPYEYYYEIYYCYCVISVVSVTVLMSIDTTYTAVVHQNLGIFNVVKHRLKLATQKGDTDDDYAYKTIVSAIRLHKEALYFIDLIESTYEILTFILIAICISFQTFGAITIMENANELLDVIRMSMFEIGAMVHLFYLSWPGQLVTNESSEIFLYAYSNEWYNVSARAKKIAHILMTRCIKPCYLTAAGLYVMNFENYGNIIKSTVSYVTVLASFR